MPVLASVLTCPACGAESAETMPENACQHSYSCPACGEMLRRRPGDCCVFCSYGSVRCPPEQEREAHNDQHGDAHGD